MADARSDVAERYATAFFELARDENSLEALEADLTALEKALADSAELRSVAQSPIFSSESKTAAFTAIAQAQGAQQLTQNLIALLGRNNRISVLPGIITAFHRMAAAHRGEVSAEAVSARPLSDEQTKALRAQIESSVGKAVNLVTSVDPSLLGGLIVKVGSRMVDSSLRTKLNRLQQTLKEA
ncbi:F0F1 ATP synthase subunit delta [Parvularcula sp. LCG005]|uniref:F0F1 ATP synthase subunit delta n=1 Tax=Parvularcula sp. LCG005 TaxID=3078805 RepID=UPI002943A125|nr:F0F1 ATP synthase subunit delta [Parvularcula sp. LCG005]WOI53081.1 F0F1 ATP synthase subunit delta [Parvularcula sp. LCG005]